MQTVVEIGRIDKVYGDRVLVKRLNEPEKKRGILVPLAYAKKKEPRKVWWAEIEEFGTQSHAKDDFSIDKCHWVGIEPLGHHYASFEGDDGNDYVWVPDEHFCLADAGSIADFYADRLDKTKEPRFRVLGERLLVRALPEAVSAIIKPQVDDPRDSKIAEVIGLGDIDEELGIKLGDHVVHVSEDSGSSCEIDIFEPKLVILRASDVIAKLSKGQEANS